MWFWTGRSFTKLPNPFVVKFIIYRYFPAGVWYDVSNGFDFVAGSVDTREGGTYVTLNTPLDTIGVHVRAGRYVEGAVWVRWGVMHRPFPWTWCYVGWFA